MSSTPGPNLEKVLMNNNAKVISDSFLHTKRFELACKTIDEKK